MAEGKKFVVKQGALKRTITAPEGVNDIAGLKKHIGDRMGITDQHSAYINGSTEKADDSQTLEEGATIEFSQNTGQKG